jgi:DNA-binding PucR family transcriptional regulator
MDLDDPDPFLLVPDADGPGREEMLLRALGESEFVIGPAVELADAALSLRLARQTLTLCRRGVIACDPPVRSADHLPTLLMLSDEDIVDLMTRGEYTLLAQMPPTKRGRLVETLLALLDGCTTPEIAARLHVHQQTVRYRLRRLHALYGDRLHDPDWRFSMQIVLRTRIVHDQETSTPAGPTRPARSRA